MKGWTLGLMLITGLLIIALFAENAQHNDTAGPRCQPPYLLVGTTCCLDANNNSICDTDDSVLGPLWRLPYKITLVPVRTEVSPNDAVAVNLEFPPDTTDHQIAITVDDPGWYVAQGNTIAIKGATGPATARTALVLLKPRPYTQPGGQTLSLHLVDLGSGLSGELSLPVVLRSAPQPPTAPTTPTTQCASNYYEYQAGQCCLDTNHNQLCDRDETTTSPQAQPAPATNTTPEEPTAEEMKARILKSRQLTILQYQTPIGFHARADTYWKLLDGDTPVGDYCFCNITVATGNYAVATSMPYNKRTKLFYYRDLVTGLDVWSWDVSCFVDEEMTQPLPAHAVKTMGPLASEDPNASTILEEDVGKNLQFATPEDILENLITMRNARIISKSSCMNLRTPLPGEQACFIGTVANEHSAFQFLFLRFAPGSTIRTDVLQAHITGVIDPYLVNMTVAWDKNELLNEGGGVFDAHLNNMGHLPSDNTNTYYRAYYDGILIVGVRRPLPSNATGDGPMTEQDKDNNAMLEDMVDRVLNYQSPLAKT